MLFGYQTAGRQQVCRAWLPHSTITLTLNSAFLLYIHRKLSCCHFNALVLLNFARWWQIKAKYMEQTKEELQPYPLPPPPLT